MKSIGYGIIGCGHFGSEVSRIINDMEDVKLVAVYSPREGAQRLSEELGCSIAISIDELVNHEDIDVIIVASPNKYHPEHAIKAAKAGKHVFCEKPLALNTADADKVIEECKQAGVVLMVGYIMRFFDGFSKMKQLIDEGVIGKPLVGYAARTGWDEPKPTTSWKKMQDISGGHLFHHIHEIDLLQWLVGPMKSVYAVGGNIMHQGEGQGDQDDILLLTMKFENGAFGTMDSGSAFRLGEHVVKINGTEGALYLNVKESMLHLLKDGKEEKFPLFNDAKSQEVNITYQNNGPAHGKSTDRPPYFFTETFPKQLIDFHAAIRGESVPASKQDLFDGTAGRSAVAVVTAALESMKKGIEVKID